MSKTDANLRALAQHWQIEMPETFSRLYRAFEYPFISPCEFLSLQEMMEDEERWRGMLPQFLPFGQDGDENFYGFYVQPTDQKGQYPVLAWNHEYDHYYPVASGFEAFTRYCVIQGRFMAQDSFEEDSSEEEKQRHAFANIVGLPANLVTEPLPRNDRELYERLLHADSQSANALSQLGSRFFGAGDLQRARDCFVRASEAAPWFADPYYLLAESYRVEGNDSRACGLWWQVFQSPIALSTRTSNYDLGEAHVECEIYEAATDHCLTCQKDLNPALQDTHLWQFVLHGDPFTSEPRLALANTLSADGDVAGTERELLNGLTLATEEEELDEAYDRLIAFYEETGRKRDAALCRRDAEQG
jgi:tetratricopeptide (TPR) repeat protein